MQVNSIAEANKYWNDSILNKRFGGINNELFITQLIFIAA